MIHTINIKLKRDKRHAKEIIERQFTKKKKKIASNTVCLYSTFLPVVGSGRSNSCGVYKSSKFADCGRALNSCGVSNLRS